MMQFRVFKTIVGILTILAVCAGIAAALWQFDNGQRSQPVQELERDLFGAPVLERDPPQQPRPPAEQPPAAPVPPEHVPPAEMPEALPAPEQPAEPAEPFELPPIKAYA